MTTRHISAALNIAANLRAISDQLPNLDADGRDAYLPGWRDSEVPSIEDVREMLGVKINRLRAHAEALIDEAKKGK